MKRLFILIALLINQIVVGQIKSGPMLGYSDMREVLLWVQTNQEADVFYKYFDKNEPSKQFTTETVHTSKKDAFIAKIIADEVLPGKTYTYEVYVNKKKVNFAYPLEFKTQTLWQFRTDPPTFKFAAGSCTFTNEERFDRPGKPYGGDMKIFTSIYEKKPDFMIWGGDNIYLREPDWNTRTGILYRYDQFRKVPEMQPLLANTHHFAIWDDHDYGPNDADRSFWNKNLALEAFKLYWGNPNYIFENQGITGTFFWEDCQFFLLDDRFFRAPNDLKDDTKEYFGKMQEDWLIDALVSSNAPFKFIITGGQVVNPAKIFETMATFPEARTRLLKRIEENKIRGVIFISGDRHHTNLQKLEREGTYPLYDVTISPLTSSSGSPVKEEENSPFVEGTKVNNKQNFGILEVSGIRTDRVLKITIYDKDGVEQWNYSIKSRDLR